MQNFLRIVFWTAMITCILVIVSKRVCSYREEIGYSLIGGPVESTRWESVDKGIQSRYVKFTGDPEDVVGLKMLRLDQSTVKAKVLYAADMGEPMMTVREMVDKSGAIAGINASYFDENDRPLGYLKVKGHEINDYIATPLIYSGIFVISSGKGKIIHRDFFAPLTCDEALQAGPRLIANGLCTQGIQNMIDFREKARRAGIAVDRKGRIVLFITSPPSAGMSWSQLQAILRGAEKNGGINPADAMNLDGGSSTQLCVRAGKYAFSEGYTRVPVAIGFFRR